MTTLAAIIAAAGWAAWALARAARKGDERREQRGLR